MPNLDKSQFDRRGQMLQSWLLTLLRKGYPRDYAIAHIEKKLSDKEFLQHFNALAASTGEHTMSIDKLKEKIQEMVTEEIEAMKECSSTGGSGIGGSPGAEIKTPNAFKRKKISRKNFVNEHKYRLALFEDVINNVTFGMKLSDQAKELMDFIRGSQSHADELNQINDLLKGMGQAGEADKAKAFQLYQEFIQNSARDFVRANASDMRPEEYFLQKDLLQLTYYFTKKFETPMTGGQDAIDKEPGEQPQDAPPPEGGDGGEGGGGGGGGSSSASSGFPDAMGDEGEAGAEGEAGTEGEAGAEGGEGEAGTEENPEGGPPKPENVKEAEKKQGIGQEFHNELEEARQLIVKLAKECIKNGNRGVAKQLVQLAKSHDYINERSSECQCTSNQTCSHCLQNRKPSIYSTSKSGQFPEEPCKSCGHTTNTTPWRGKDGRCHSCTVNNRPIKENASISKGNKK